MLGLCRLLPFAATAPADSRRLSRSQNQHAIYPCTQPYCRRQWWPRVYFASTTEGEDKPLKYAPIFHGADLVLITKIDLAEAVGFDRATAHAAIARVAPTPACWKPRPRNRKRPRRYRQKVSSSRFSGS